jgi:hypothetical protein
MPHTGDPVQIRVGINTGKVMAGLIGRIRRQYRLFGESLAYKLSAWVIRDPLAWPCCYAVLVILSSCSDLIF